MDAGAGNLPAGVETGDARPPVEVGEDAAARVVGGGGHRDEVGHRVDPGFAAARHDGGEAGLEGGDRAGVEEHVVGAERLHPPRDGLGHDVARSEVGERVVSRGDDAVAERVDQEGPLAAHGLADERLLAGRVRAEPERRRVELHELEVGHLGTGTEGEGHAVAGRDGRVGGAGEDLAHPPGREDHGAGVHGPDAVLGPLAEHVQRDPRRTPVRGAQQVEHERVLDHLDPRVGEDRGDQGPRDLRAGRVAPGVHDPVAVMAALAGQGQLAGGVEVEVGTQGDQLPEPAGAFLAEHPDGPPVADADPGLEGVALVLQGRVVGTEGRGDASLRPAGRAVVDMHLRHDQHPTRAGRVQSRHESGHAGADDDHVGRGGPARVRSEQPGGPSETGQGHQTSVGSSSYEPTWTSSPRTRPVCGSASAGSVPVPITLLPASTKTTRGCRVRASSSSICP